MYGVVDAQRVEHSTTEGIVDCSVGESTYTQFCFCVNQNTPPGQSRVPLGRPLRTTRAPACWLPLRRPSSQSGRARSCSATQHVGNQREHFSTHAQKQQPNTNSQIENIRSIENIRMVPLYICGSAAVPVRLDSGLTTAELPFCVT